MRFVLDEGLPCGPLTVVLENGKVRAVEAGAQSGARPATAGEAASFWDHFWGRGRFAYRFDFSSLSPFQVKTLHALAEVKVGERVSYGELAFMTGHARAYRAVGTAMAKNPFPILYPCHRVVRSGGDLGRYGFAGPGTKGKLLAWEAGLVGNP